MILISKQLFVCFFFKKISNKQESSIHIWSHIFLDSSSDSSSSSSSSESEAEPERKSTPEPPPPVKILTEKEMNQLGAKIVRAELMGNAVSNVDKVWIKYCYKSMSV